MQIVLSDARCTGESLKALETLVDEAGGLISSEAAVLAEGQAADRTDIIFLEKLPIFPRDL